MLPPMMMARDKYFDFFASGGDVTRLRLHAFLPSAAAGSLMPARG